MFDTKTFDEHEEGSIPAKYVRCKVCNRWINNDRELGWIDIHAQPHDHTVGQQDLFPYVPPEK